MGMLRNKNIAVKFNFVLSEVGMGGILSFKASRDFRTNRK
jgi:hypothetical protein